MFAYSDVNMSVNHTIKRLALFSTLHPGGIDEYRYPFAKFVLSGGVSFKILTHSDIVQE